MMRRSSSGKDRITAEEFERIAPSPEVFLTSVVFSQAFNTFAKALERAVRPVGLTVSQYVALWALLLSPEPMTPTEISRLLPIETHSVSALLNRLYERKLVSRRRSKVDRRTVHVSLTANGEQLIKEISPAVSALMMDVFQTLSSRELQLLKRLTQKLRNANARWLGANPEHLETTMERITGAIQSLHVPN